MNSTTVLLRTAKVLQDDTRPSRALMEDVVGFLTGAWQFPDIACARIFFEETEARSDNYRSTEWAQSAPFSTQSGARGGIEICYLEERPAAEDGPFLSEERALIDTVAEMFRSHFQHAKALEGLKQLASELSLSEARQRRAIAQELHDHIGQALAFIRMRVMRFQGDAVFCGFEDNITGILHLLDQAINSTRNLTFEISPPVLYELGLAAALQWLGERFGKDRELAIIVTTDKAMDELPDDTRVVLFHSVRELLINAIKHARARTVAIKTNLRGHEATVEVTDDGSGFDVDRLSDGGTDGTTFGLFSIRERLNYLGGSMTIRSGLGRGTTVTLTAPVPSGQHRERP